MYIFLQYKPSRVAVYPEREYRAEQYVARSVPSNLPSSQYHSQRPQQPCSCVRCSVDILSNTSTTPQLLYAYDLL